jgi:hypothetical protein
MFVDSLRDWARRTLAHARKDHATISEKMLRHNMTQAIAGQGAARLDISTIREFGKMPV